MLQAREAAVSVPAASRAAWPDEVLELRGPGTPLPALLAGLWRARPVLVMLARQDFYARYRRTRLGLLWAAGLPLIQAIVLSIVFTHVVRFGAAVQHALGAGSFSYPVFVYAGLTAWAFFSGNLLSASTAIVDNRGMASRIYFPRAFFPLLVVASGVYPLLITLVILLLLTVALQGGITVAFLWVIPGAALTLAVTSGFGLLLSAAHVYFRDIRFLVQAALSVMLYLSPVLYSLSTAPLLLRHVLTYSPMSGPIELFRLAVRSADPNWPTAVAGGLGWFAVLTVVGLWLQSRYDRVFVDLL